MAGADSSGSPLLPVSSEKGDKGDGGLGFTRDEFVGAVVVLGFMTVSSSMGFINKAVLMTAFVQSNVLLLLQQIVTPLLIISLKEAGVLKDCRLFNFGLARKSMGVVLLYNANVAFALGALRLMNVPMYNVIKRLNPSVVLVYKLMYGTAKERPSLNVAAAVGCMVISTFVAGAGDLGLDWYGYGYGVASCILQAAYLLLVEKTGTEKELNSAELLFYNGVLSAPFILLFTALSGELFEAGPALLTAYNSSGSFWLLLVVTLFGGSLLNYMLFLCTQTTSALTTTIAGQCKTIITTVLGFFLLGGVTATPLLVLGVTINTVGGLWYAYAKHCERGHKAQGPSTLTPGHGHGGEGPPAT